jgi:predicted molibdopterin-dependent oxidoreductase YjgC
VGGIFALGEFRIRTIYGGCIQQFVNQREAIVSGEFSCLWIQQNSKGKIQRPPLRHRIHFTSVAWDLARKSGGFTS